jgi:hypothetical protein
MQSLKADFPQLQPQTTLLERRKIKNLDPIDLICIVLHIIIKRKKDFDQY